MFQLISDYFFKSKHRYWALLKLFIALLCVAGSITSMYLLFVWFDGFMAALAAASVPLFLASLQTLLAITIVYTVLKAVKEAVIGSLINDWREWLTDELSKDYTSPENEHNYLEVERRSTINNPSQRLQQDVKIFTAKTIHLGIGILESLLNFGVFVGTLWKVGGAATLTILGVSIIIPGYLVWLAILIAVTSTLITHFIGKKLIELSDESQTLEADYRQDIETLANNAESVAQDRGEPYFQQSMRNKFQRICRNAYEIIQIRVGLTAFNSFYQNVSIVIPYLVAAPLYFAKKTTLGQLMQIAMSFGQIQFALSWFSDSYEDIAKYSAMAKRVAGLKNAMTGQSVETRHQSIVVHENTEAEALTIQHLSLLDPESTSYMLRELNLTFRPGEHTVIKGRTGLGKSTLFKAMAKVWRYGEGEITVSSPENTCFLPQRPVIHDNTLKAILAYPDNVDTYTDEECLVALRAIGGMEKHFARLNTNAPWSRTLSLGEQQRVSFARALLKRPTWLFLDEATSAIDEPSEKHLYSLILRELNQTTFISIAHRSTVDEHHNRIITLDVDDEKNAVVRETFFARSAPIPVVANDEEAFLVSAV